MMSYNLIRSLLFGLFTIYYCRMNIWDVSSENVSLSMLKMQSYPQFNSTLIHSIVSIDSVSKKQRP